VTLIHGIDAVVDKDVKVGFAGLPSCYKVTWKGVNLRDSSAIITALKELDAEGQSDLIGIIRGGGDLEIFDNVEVAYAAAELNTPFIAAIGHVVDRHLCDQIADKDFGTPTALGVFLEKMVEQAEDEFARERGLSKRSRTLEAKEVEFSRRSAELSQRESKLIQQLTEEQQPALSDRTVIHQQPEPHLNRGSKLLYLTAGVLIGVLIGILIVRGVNRSGEGSVPEANQNQQVQPTPAMSGTPAASPTGETRRKRKATSGQ
jgi:F0F1-type ATP synthase assembly protein I